MNRTIVRFVKGAFAALGYDIQKRQDPTEVLVARLREESQEERVRREARGRALLATGADKVHYGSANNLFGKGWINVDLGSRQAENYLQANLTERHPFPDGCFRFGFAEDFLEHLEQEQSLRFLIEACRTLRPGGVLRLSFPGLESTLSGGYTPPTFETAQLARIAYYEQWGHKHFYAISELEFVARHVGFAKVQPVEHGLSDYPELCGLDQRFDQIGSNTYIELVK
jgi:predicted SAM-dependent methyltransferase